MAAKAKRQAEPGLEKLTYSQAQEQLEQALAQLQSESLPFGGVAPACSPSRGAGEALPPKLEQVSQDIQKLDPDAISLSPWQEEEDERQPRQATDLSAADH